MENLNNYKKEKLTISLLWANMFGLIVLVIVLIIYGVPYYLFWPEHFTNSHIQTYGDNSITNFPGSSFLIVIIIIIAGIVMHELIHGLTWSQFTDKGFKSIKFGIKWKMLTPYCHCKEPLQVKHYILGTLMPAIILGFLPAVLSFIFGSTGLLLIGIFFTVAASGDFLIVYLLRNESRNALVQDHPSQVGCFIYRK